MPKAKEIDYGNCWRCGSPISIPGLGSYFCSSGNWVRNGTAGSVASFLNQLRNSKTTSPADKKEAALEAIAYGWLLGLKAKSSTIKEYKVRPNTENLPLEQAIAPSQRLAVKKLCIKQSTVV